ncbi:hypothetical protein AGLY_001378, partial [Aphis glycines]
VNEVSLLIISSSSILFINFEGSSQKSPLSSTPPECQNNDLVLSEKQKNKLYNISTFQIDIYNVIKVYYKLPNIGLTKFLFASKKPCKCKTIRFILCAVFNNISNGLLEFKSSTYKRSIIIEFQYFMTETLTNSTSIYTKQLQTASALINKFDHTDNIFTKSTLIVFPILERRSDLLSFELNWCLII